MIDLARATHIEVEVEPRYWEDAIVNGVVDSDGALIPGRAGDLWKVRLSLADGRIEDWPAGITARIHYKVCDAGEYWLTDEHGVRIAKWRGSSVPTGLLCHGDRGWGDYIILTITEGGLVSEYVRTNIAPEHWASI